MWNIIFIGIDDLGEYFQEPNQVKALSDFKNNIIKISEGENSFVVFVSKKYLDEVKNDTAENFNDENNNNYNLNKHNARLPDKLYFGEREVKINDEYMSNYSIDNPQQIKISSLQGARSTFGYKKHN